MSEKVVQTILQLKLDAREAQALPILLKSIATSADNASKSIRGLFASGGRRASGILDASGNPYHTDAEEDAPPGRRSRQPRPPREPKPPKPSKIDEWGYRSLTAALAHHVGQTLSGAVEQYMSGGVTMAGGLSSGSLQTAMSSVVQGELQRTMALRTAGIAGGTGLVGVGMAGVGALPTSVTHLGGFARGGLIIAGVLLTYAGQIGAAIANAQAQRLAAQQQSAIGLMGQIRGAREPLAAAQLAGMPYGSYLTDEVLKGSYKDWGYSGTERQAMYTKYRTMRGLQFGSRENMAWNIEAFARAGIPVEATAMMGSVLAPGRGGTMRMDASPLSFMGHFFKRMDESVATGLELGLQKADMPELFQRMSSVMTRFGERGAAAEWGSLNESMRGYGAAGFRGMQGLQAIGAQQGYIGNLIDTMGGMRLPPQAVQAIMMRHAIQRFGGFDNAMVGLQGLLHEPKSADQFVEEAGAWLPGAIRTPFMQQIRNLLPTLAVKKTVERPGAAGDVIEATGPWKGAVGEARGIMGTDVGYYQSMRGFEENTIAFAKSLDELTKIVMASVVVIRAGLRNVDEKYREGLETTVGMILAKTTDANDRTREVGRHFFDAMSVWSRE